MLRKMIIASLLCFGSLHLGGCVALGIGAAGGYIAADEMHEHDGKFDPLEDVRGKGDGKN